MDENNCILNEEADQPRPALTEKALGKAHGKKRCSNNYGAGN